jgi:hypothetical protein
MLRRFAVLASVALSVVSVAAQAPAGWSVRVDRSTSPSDPDNTPDLKFVRMGTGFHVTGGPAGVFWNPANTATGNYTASATFTLTKPSSHTNYYGLVFGGSDLAAANQSYIYFTVAQNGTYLIKHRAGEETHDVQGYTKHDAVKVPGADGKSVNTLEVRVAGNTISYVVNGTVVHTTPKTGMTAKTDGLVGVRINHVLDVHVDGFAVKKA